MKEYGTEDLIGLILWKYWLRLPDYDLHNVLVFSIADTLHLDPYPALGRNRYPVHDKSGLLES